MARVTIRTMKDLIDIGANLSHDSFDNDRNVVLEESRAAGVLRLIVTGTSVSESRRAIDLSLADPVRLFATAGIHPHHATDYDHEARAQLEDLAAHAKVVAIGECGLDYFRNFSPRDAQLTAFTGQLELAQTVGKPVFLHQRDAHAEFLETIKTVSGKSCAGVAHCFTGGIEELEAYLELGLYIGVTGWVCDERRGGDLRTAVPRIPLDRILLETDAPYLLPRTLRPRPKTRRNEPRWLPHIASVVAELLQVTVEDLAVATTANAERLFDLPPTRTA